MTSLETGHRGRSQVLLRQRQSVAESGREQGDSERGRKEGEGVGETTVRVNSPDAHTHACGQD